MNRKNYELPVEILSDTPDFEARLRKIAAKLVARPKGIFAADESGGNIHKKFGKYRARRYFRKSPSLSRKCSSKHQILKIILSGIICLKKSE